MSLENASGPVVSIIVSTYNHAKYIHQAMDSIFMQKIAYDYEVLVGDDASTDGTQDILIKYVEKCPGRVKLFLREKNLGATKNVYELLMAAKGKYLANLEGDDYWTDSGKLQQQIDFLEDNPGFIGVCHKFATVDSDGNSIKKRVGWVKHKRIFKLSDFQGIYLPSQISAFVRRNIYLDKESDYSFLYKINRMIADRTAMLLFLSKGDFYCFDEIMSVYRISTGLDTSSITKILYRKNKDAVKMDLEYTEKLETLGRELGIEVDFTRHRKILYTSSVIRYIRTLDKKNILVLKKIRGNRGRAGFLAYVPLGIIKRFFGRM